MNKSANSTITLDPGCLYDVQRRFGNRLQSRHSRSEFSEKRHAVARMTASAGVKQRPSLMCGHPLKFQPKPTPLEVSQVIPWSKEVITAMAHGNLLSIKNRQLTYLDLWRLCFSSIHKFLDQEPHYVINIDRHPLIGSNIDLAARCSYQPDQIKSAIGSAATYQSRPLLIGLIFRLFPLIRIF